MKSPSNFSTSTLVSVEALADAEADAEVELDADALVLTLFFPQPATADTAKRDASNKATALLNFLIFLSSFNV
jgi:hypothetical protein